MSIRSQSQRALAAVALACGAASASAGVVINLNDIGGVTGTPAEQGFKIAAKYWESVLTNDAVINFNVGFNHLPPNVLGGTNSNLATSVQIGDYYGALAANGNKSALDNQALANLAALDASGSVTVKVPSYFNGATFEGVASSGTRVAPTNTAISTTMALSTANLKALVGGGQNVVDAKIEFSSDFAFDFNPTDGIAAGKSDFIGVAIHEMGHALGFLSGADDFDYSVGGGFKTDDFWWGYALDMFRYSQQGQLDWSFGTESYFSLDGGATAYGGGHFSTGENNGDGWQASHWKAPTSAPFCSGLEGVMNPYLCSGTEAIVTSLDLAALDAIGWNVAIDVQQNPGYAINTAQIYAQFAASGVPEPVSLALVLSSLGLLGVARRRSRNPV